MKLEEKIQALTKEVLSSPKKANKIRDLIDLSEKSLNDAKKAFICLKAFYRVYSSVLKSEQLSSRSKLSGEKGKIYKDWMIESLTNWRSIVLKYVKFPNLQDRLFKRLLLLMILEEEKPIYTAEGYFTNCFLKEIILSLLAVDISMENGLETLQEHLKHADIRFQCLKYLFELMEEVLASVKTLDSEGVIFLTNCYTLLNLITSEHSQNKEDVENSVKFKLSTTTKGNINYLQPVKHSSLLSKTWLQLLKFKLPNSIYKQVLVEMPDKIIPKLPEPLGLADFLTNSFNVGGVISLLALHGLFILIHKHNLNYPSFFEKVYELIRIEILNVKYKSRFFFLLNLFLSSTHLPAYVIAAFVKKLARLALRADCCDGQLLLNLVYVLLVRHISCKCLLHNEDAKSFETDPYREDEQDLSKCGALSSSLWELRTLEYHWNPKVAQIALQARKPLPAMEPDFLPSLDLDSESVFESEKKRKYKDIHLTVFKPENLFGGEDDRCKNIFRSYN